MGRGLTLFALFLTLSALENHLRGEHRFRETGSMVAGGSGAGTRGTSTRRDPTQMQYLQACDIDVAHRDKKVK